MEPDFEPTALGTRLRVAQCVRALPDFPGRDTLLVSLLRPAFAIDAPVRGTFGGGLRFEGNPATDDNVVEMLQLRFARPALAPILDAALEPGGLFADVGANHGIYTLWGARCVADTGQVHAFEPLPEVRNCLERNLVLNGFANATVVGQAVGAEPGETTLYRMAHASGRTSRYLEDAAEPLFVPVTTLDAHFEGRALPQLVKIDVEGMEHQVLRGAVRLLESDQAPAVVFEADPALLGAAGTSYPELLQLLDEHGGYRVWSLQTCGLRPEADDASVPGSMNVLALRPDLPAHERLQGRLHSVHFAVNQNA